MSDSGATPPNSVDSAADSSPVVPEASAPDARLRAFQERLSDRLRETAAAPRQARLGVMVGGRYFLVDLSEAGEIVAVPPAFAAVPMAKSWLRGLVNLRGSLYAVTDLAEFFGDPPSVIGRESRLLVFADRVSLNAALLVDRMLGLQDLATMRPGPDGEGNWVDDSGRSWSTLGLQQLALDERFLSIGA